MKRCFWREVKPLAGVLMGFLFLQKIEGLRLIKTPAWSEGANDALVIEPLAVILSRTNFVPSIRSKRFPSLCVAVGYPSVLRWQMSRIL